MSTELAKTEPAKTPIAMTKTGVSIHTMEDAYRFAVCVAKSGFAPKGYEAAESIVVGIQFGAEIGLTPMQSLQNIAVIQGRPAIFGDAAKALVLSSGLCEDFKETIEGEADNMTAVCSVKRRGFSSDTVVKFSVADAKRANLWGKQGPWTQYPKRMLQMRARSFALRDAFPDVLKGLTTPEELQDTIEHEAVNEIFRDEPNPGSKPKSKFQEARAAVRQAKHVDAEVIDAEATEAPAGGPAANEELFF